MSRDDIYAKVCETLAEVLGVVEDDTTLEAHLITDLGADRVGLLDISLRLENALDILIPPSESFLENMADFESSHIERGFVAEDGIEVLRKQLPHANVDKFAEDPRVEHIQNLFTVEMVGGR
ncbi:MAG: acyl carrier protein, partial [Pirellulaceae bacterium]